MRRFLTTALTIHGFCFASAILNADVGGKKLPEPRSETQDYSFYTLPVCGKGANNYWASLRHIEGNGVGYQMGYSTLEAFLSLAPHSKVHPFVDLRGHIFNDGKWASNVGLGLRYLIEPIQAVFGLNTFYDFREAQHGRYHQVGAGVEWLFKRWDVRSNGYLPVGAKNHLYANRFDQFQGHHAIFVKKYEQAMKGIDLLVGREAYRCRYFDLHATVGGYYFAGHKGKDAGGGLARLEARITPYITIMGQFSYDGVFKDIYQGSIALNFPFGKRAQLQKAKGSCTDRILLEERLVEPIDRFEIPVVDHRKKKQLALNPETGQPLYFVFVDNQRGSSTGSFGNPYHTLLDAQNHSSPGDVIYVFAGNGTSSGMDQGITLKENQFLIGSGTSFVVNTSSGQQTIPAQTKIMPMIINRTPGAATITLSNNNMIAGLNIGGSEYGIQGTNIANLQIQNNALSGATVAEISLTNCSSNISIANNSFVSTQDSIDMVSENDMILSITQNTFTVLQDTFPINLIATSPLTSTSLALMNISSNSITQSNALASSGISLVQQNNSVVSGVMQDNFILGAGAGMTINPTDQSETNLCILGNNVINATSAGINLEAVDNSVCIFDIENNRVVNANQSGGGNHAIQVTGTATSTVLRLLNNYGTTAGNSNTGFLLTTVTCQSPDSALLGVASFNLGTSVGANTMTKIGAVETSGVTFTSLVSIPSCP